MMLIGAFPNAKTSEATSQVYETMLADLDAGLARRAVTRLIGTSKFLPTISEIREACGVVPLAAPYHREWKPRLTSAKPAPRLAQRNNRAREALVVTNGAAGPGAGPAPAKDAASSASPAAPADLRVAPTRQPPAPARAPRRWTAEELDAELARSAGGAP